MFTQVDRTGDHAGEGLGIGLALVRQLVQLHEGKVEAHSSGLGRGSEFDVRLPVLADQAVRRELPQPPDASKLPEPAPARRVLVVDDNQDSARSLAQLLKLSGHESRVAYDGAEAIDAAEQFRPQVVLLDIGLPKVNGFDVCRHIRQQEWGREALLVALTGWGQTEDRQKTQKAGFDQHLVKPIDFTELTKLLTRSPASSATEPSTLNPDAPGE
jgi:CheY-like chemotaxis protein